MVRVVLVEITSEEGPIIGGQGRYNAVARALTSHASAAGDLCGEQQASCAYTEQCQMSRPLKIVFVQLESFVMRNEMKSGFP
jgi:hypothetical protein